MNMEISEALHQPSSLLIQYTCLFILKNENYIKNKNIFLLKLLFSYKGYIQYKIEIQLLLANGSRALSVLLFKAQSNNYRYNYSTDITLVLLRSNITMYYLAILQELYILNITGQKIKYIAKNKGEYYSNEHYVSIQPYSGINFNFNFNFVWIDKQYRLRTRTKLFFC